MEEARASRRPRSRPQRGNALLVTLIALTGLGTLGIATVTSVQSSISASVTDRARAIALHAAESGINVGMRYMGLPVYDYEPFPAQGFSYIVLPNGQEYGLPGLPGNRVLPGNPNNVFSPELEAWYDVTVRNNRTDPGWNDLADFEDRDGRVILTSIGYGPDRASVTIEVEVQYRESSESFAILSWREIE